MLRLFLVTVFVLSTGLSTAWSAIVLDYRHAGGTFFDAATPAKYNAAAMAAVNAAVADINAILTLNLASIHSMQAVSGTVGRTTLNVNLAGIYTQPTTGLDAAVSLPLATNEIRIFVGTQSLVGSTLGVGGFSLSARFTGGGDEPDWAAAVAAASSNAAATFTRGGPTMGTLIQPLSLGAQAATFQSPIGPSLGSLWFNENTDWHFDHTTAVDPAKHDLYSVAMREVLHSIGIGTSESWDRLVTGQDWTGTEVLAESGSGSNFINPAGNRVLAGIMSERISDGVLQEVVIAPGLSVGTRRQLTQLDLAFLRDIGYSANSITAIPEPNLLFALSIVGAGMLARQRGRVRTTSQIAKVR